MKKKLIFEVLSEMSTYLGSYEVSISDDEVEFNDQERDICFVIKYDKYDEEFKVEVKKYSELTLLELNLITTIIKKLED